VRGREAEDHRPKKKILQPTLTLPSPMREREIKNFVTSQMIKVFSASSVVRRDS